MTSSRSWGAGGSARAPELQAKCPAAQQRTGRQDDEGLESLVLHGANLLKENITCSRSSGCRGGPPVFPPDYFAATASRGAASGRGTPGGGAPAGSGSFRLSIPGRPR